MLASTVQFSSNDQPPTTPTRRLSSLGPASRRASNARTLRYPTACPAHSIHHHVPRRSSTSDNQPSAPNSQRSTHELTTVEHLPT
ncbi:hypothetical protein BKA18_004234 [Streptomyces auratus]